MKDRLHGAATLNEFKGNVSLLREKCEAFYRASFGKGFYYGNVLLNSRSNKGTRFSQVFLIYGFFRDSRICENDVDGRR